MPVRLLHPIVLVTLLALALVWISTGSSPAVAKEGEQSSRVFVPMPPKGKGDKCVADTDFMRRNHMTMLDHQRDGTVHEGIRTKRFSLNECISCHAVQGPDARPLTINSPKHFCRSCHDYAAVKIDCFECHASRPEAGNAARGPADLDEGGLQARLARFLEDTRQ